MPLFARSYNELMVDSLDDLNTNTNLTKLGPGGIARGIIEAVNKRLNEAYEIFDLNLARSFVSSSNGQLLDLIGYLLGCVRDTSLSALITSNMEVVKFYVDSGTFGNINSNNDIVINQGLIISTQSNQGGVRYKTLEMVVLPSSGDSQFISVEALLPGTDSHLGTGSLVNHSFIGYTDYLNKTLKVTNAHSISNARNLESDANYRYRIVNKVLEAEAANLTAIRLACLSTPGVADIVLIPRYRGIGTFGVIIKATTSTVSQTLIDEVTSTLQRVLAYGNIAYVIGPLETGISMKVTIWYGSNITDTEMEDIESNVTTAIIDYVNALDIGQTLYINQLINQLFDVSDSIANFGQPNKPIDELYIYTQTELLETKIRQTLLNDYAPATNERVIIEPSVSVPIVFERKLITTGRNI